MAIAYKSETTSAIPQAATQLYIVPSLTEAVVSALYIANVHATETAYVHVSVAGVKIGNSLEIPSGATLQFVIRPIYLTEDETVVLERATSTGALNAHVSILEKS